MCYGNLIIVFNDGNVQSLKIIHLFIVIAVECM